MANISPNEISICKACSCKLNPDTICFLTYFVHTETFTDKFTGKQRQARDKSVYTYIGRVEKIKDLENEITDMKNRPTEKWVWPNMDPRFTTVSYDGNDTNKRGAKWYSDKLKKSVDWPTFCKILNGFKPAHGEYCDVAKYPINDYQVSDGTIISDITANPEALIALAGKTFEHRCVMKSQIKNK